jgi:hypothetical protein
MGSAVRRFCVKFDPRREVEVIAALARHGRLTGDRSGSVFWLEGPVSERQLEDVPGVDRVIECVQPLWPDVFPSDPTPLPPQLQTSSSRHHDDPE